MAQTAGLTAEKELPTKQAVELPTSHTVRGDGRFQNMMRKGNWRKMSGN